MTDVRTWLGQKPWRLGVVAVAVLAAAGCGMGTASGSSSAKAPSEVPVDVSITEWVRPAVCAPGGLTERVKAARQRVVAKDAAGAEYLSFAADHAPVEALALCTSAEALTVVPLLGTGFGDGSPERSVDGGTSVHLAGTTLDYIRSGRLDKGAGRVPLVERDDPVKHPGDTLGAQRPVWVVSVPGAWTVKRTVGAAGHRFRYLTIAFDAANGVSLTRAFTNTLPQGVADLHPVQRSVVIDSSAPLGG